MKRQNFLQFGLPLLALMLVLGYFAPDIARWVEDQLENRRKTMKEAELLATGALLVSSEGRVSVVAPSPIGSQAVDPGNHDLLLRQGYIVETGPRAWAQIQVRSGRLETGDYSQVQFELWNPTDASSPVYILIHRGRLRVLEESRPGEVFILHDGRLSALNLTFNDLAQEQSQRIRQLQVDQSELHDLRDATQASLELQGLSLDEALDERLLEEDLTHSSPEFTEDLSDSEAMRVSTLSNSYIDDVIGAQRRGFQRCQANNLRDNLPAQGELVFGIRISPRGQIEEIKTIKNTVGDETLENCVRSIFERLRFRSFEGAPIERSYPLNFE